jgi:EAL domain-containing protein (putative c-di-GMP-specific phosphodiesterase class I)
LKKASTQENFPPSRLEIEITETALVSDIETAKMILTALQASGLIYKISLDDFGTGYSTLYHLRELRFDKIKIDRRLCTLRSRRPCNHYPSLPASPNR